MSDFEADRVFIANAIAKGPDGPQSFLARLDAANNELEVRERLAGGQYNAKHAALAEEWLRRREDARQVEATARAEAREEESLSAVREANAIARSASFAATAAAAAASEANEIARSNRRIAISAAIIAAVAAAAAIVASIAAVMGVK